MRVRPRFAVIGFFADWNYQRDPAPHLPPHNNTRLTHLWARRTRTCAPSRWPWAWALPPGTSSSRSTAPKAQGHQGDGMLQALYEIAERPIPEDHLQLMLAGDSRIAGSAGGRHRAQHPPGRPARAHPTQTCTCRTLPPRHHLRHWAPWVRANLSGRWPAPWMRWSAALVQRIATRPAVEGRRAPGLLPGDLAQKVDPTCARCTTPCMN